MSFHPSQHLGRPLPDVLAELAQANVDELLAHWAGRVELHSPAGAVAGERDIGTLRPGSMIDTLTQPHLPETHPDVDVPDVVLETFLGGGNQGWVYAGRVKSTGAIVAVKVLRKDYVEAQGWAVREAALCSRVRHRNILRVFCWQPAGAVWVVIMELVQGPELAAASLAVPQLKSVLGQLADGLLALSRQGIVHCDVKPANVLLRHYDRSPVLVDFGMAVDVATMDRKSVEVGGTPLYMPPEAYRTPRPGPGWDAYALGMTAAVLLVGRAMLSGPSGTYNDLATLRQAKVSGDFDRLVRRALEGGVQDADLRDGALALLHSDPKARVKALETARKWV